MPLFSRVRAAWLVVGLLSGVWGQGSAQGLGALGGLPPGINIPAAAAALSSLGVGGGLGLGATALPQTPAIRSSDVLPSAATAPTGPRLSEAQTVGTLYAPPNEFQRFVLETSGYKLPVYGMAYFDNAQFSRSAPANSPGFGFLDNSPVSGDYLLGVGDQLLMRGWGSDRKSTRLNSSH